MVMNESDHAALSGDLRELEQAISNDWSKDLKDLRLDLVKIQTRIMEHFRFEEQGGYMDTLKKRDPRLERTIGHLAEEHCRLAQSLDSLIKEAKAATTLSHPLRSEIQKWIEDVRQHKGRETNLIQDAFNLDIGAED